MRQPYVFGTCVVTALVLAGNATHAAKPKRQASETAASTLILPEGVRNIPNYGLCRERAPGAETTQTPQQSMPVAVVTAPSAQTPREKRVAPPAEPVVAVVTPRKSHGKGAVSGKVTFVGGNAADAANTVVSIEGVPGGRPAAGKNHPQIFQRDLAFVPALNVVTVGTSIDFPNQDHVFHNIFSVSESAKFDLGLYKAGESRSVTFTRAGVIDVYCNIHPQMISEIKVLDTRFYAVTGKDGTFHIDDVPEGKYRIAAWHTDSEEVKEEVEVKANQTTEHMFTLSTQSGHTNHLRKDGTPYGRYK